MSKATQKDELLAELAYLDQAEYIDKQACVQLKAIVEQHFSIFETDMGKWLYRFYHSWQLFSEGVLDGEAEKAYAEICKRLEKSIADTEAEQKIPPTVFSEKLVEDCWKEHDAKVDKERAGQSGVVDREIVDNIIRCVLNWYTIMGDTYGELDWDETRKGIRELLQQPVQVDEETKNLGIEPEPTDDD